jgi:NtrC-family two-component system response regulator AlgB
MSHNALHRTTKDFPLSAPCNSQEDACKTPSLVTPNRLPPLNVLIVDDEPTIRRRLKIALESMGHHVVDAKDSAQALELVSHRPFEVAFLDMRLGQERGVDLLPEMLRLAPGLTVIIFTAYATIENAVEAMRRGAFDYILKPTTPDQLRVVLAKVADFRRLRGQVDALEDQVRSVIPEADLRTENQAMRQELYVAFRAAESNATILIRGESGTGKGVLARAIHARSPQAHAPFVTIHCPSLSVELLESELFGHVRGAFTGAVQDTLGKVHSANGGILFLDEIGDLPFALQPKLLRLLQEKRYERVGETTTRIANVRVLAATNRNLEADVATGKFRQDLFYRLNVISVTPVPLRQRKADILPLARHLLTFFARESGKQISSYSPEAEAALLECPWPGNIRELRNTVERAVILARCPTIGVEELPSHVIMPEPQGVEVGAHVTVDQLVTEHIRRLVATTGTVQEAAVILGIDPSTVWRRRKRLGL